MSIELLLNEDVEHSEKHDLESFFYVLLYICTMYSRPGTWNEGDIKDNSHPFGQWMDESNWYQIGAVRNLVFSNALRTQLVFQHVHSYFTPLIPMLDQLCDAIYLSPEQTKRTPEVPCGTHANVLRILAHFFDRLPDQDDSPDTEHLPTPDAEIAPTVTAPVKRILWPRFNGSRRAASNGNRSEQRSIFHHGTDSGYGGDETLSSPHGREDDLGSGSLRRSPRSPKKRSSTQSVSGPSKRRRGNASGT
jgi:Fungal protein kinase